MSKFERLPKKWYNWKYERPKPQSEGSLMEMMITEREKINKFLHDLELNFFQAYLFAI